jgi:hypothetical protein
MEQLKVGTNDLLSVVKKKVDAASVLSTESFSMAGLALQLEVAVVATSEAVQLRETLPHSITSGGHV